MKAGTTSLYQYLGAHPEIFMSSIKELDFFVEELNWRRGLDWYKSQFSRAPSGTIALGEVSTSYTMYPQYQGVPERIVQLLPTVRLIYILRDPIDRIRSHYQHNVTTRSERGPIDRTVLEDPAYVNCSRYALQIEQYLDHFSPRQLMIITSENLRVERQETMRRVFGFLGVDPEFVPPNLGRDFYRTDERVSYPPLIASLRRELKKHIPGVRLSTLGSLPPQLGGNPSRKEITNRKANVHLIGPEARMRLEALLREDQSRLRAYLEDNAFFG
jgi:hypothetical protein